MTNGHKYKTNFNENSHKNEYSLKFRKFLKI
jgi:hypothetical protein